ncbi:MAG TPA: hypothetical protein V6D07_18525 [Trichocoleus sp.]
MQTKNLAQVRDEIKLKLAQLESGEGCVDLKALSEEMQQWHLALEQMTGRGPWSVLDCLAALLSLGEELQAVARSSSKKLPKHLGRVELQTLVTCVHCICKELNGDSSVLREILAAAEAESRSEG